MSRKLLEKKNNLPHLEVERFRFSENRIKRCRPNSRYDGEDDLDIIGRMKRGQRTEEEEETAGPFIISGRGEGFSSHLV